MLIIGSANKNWQRDNSKDWFFFVWGGTLKCRTEKILRIFNKEKKKIHKCLVTNNFLSFPVTVNIHTMFVRARKLPPMKGGWIRITEQQFSRDIQQQLPAISCKRSSSMLGSKSLPNTSVLHVSLTVSDISLSSVSPIMSRISNFRSLSSRLSCVVASKSKIKHFKNHSMEMAEPPLNIFEQGSS